MRLALEKVAGMLGTMPPEGLSGEAAGYSIDSRSAGPGEVFFAVRGEKRDGHQFVEAALAAGAAAAVASRGALRHRGRLLLVADPRAGLQRLAARARRRWSGRLVAITGSNGKTTTKEITATLLGARFRVARSEGNLNNDLGLPLSLLRMEDPAEVAVMEMGMNHGGEIRALAAIARPDIGVVTNVNPVHLEFFTCLDDIAAAKRELIESLPEGGTAVLNGDDERVRRFGEAHRGPVVYFGVETEADVRAVEVEDLGLGGTRFRLEAGGRQFHLPLAGRHNLYNALAGLAVARALDVDPESLVDQVASLAPARMRGERIEVAGIQIINDCYNSNPSAVERMLDLLASIQARRRVAVLGEMLELGPGSESLHRQIGARLAREQFDLVVGVGGAARFLVDQAHRNGLPPYRLRFFEEAEAAGEFLRTALEEGDAVLFKGSRGVGLERALEPLLG